MHTPSILVTSVALLSTFAVAEPERPKFYFPRQIKRQVVHNNIAQVEARDIPHRRKARADLHGRAPDGTGDAIAEAGAPVSATSSSDSSTVTVIVSSTVFAEAPTTTTNSTTSSTTTNSTSAATTAGISFRPDGVVRDTTSADTGTDTSSDTTSDTTSDSTTSDTTTSDSGITGPTTGGESAAATSSTSTSAATTSSDTTAPTTTSTSGGNGSSSFGDIAPDVSVPDLSSPATTTDLGSATTSTDSKTAASVAAEGSDSGSLGGTDPLTSLVSVTSTLDPTAAADPPTTPDATTSNSVATPTAALIDPLSTIASIVGQLTSSAIDTSPSTSALDTSATAASSTNVILTATSLIGSLTSSPPIIGVGPVVNATQPTVTVAPITSTAVSIPVTVTSGVLPPSTNATVAGAATGVATGGGTGVATGATTVDGTGVATGATTVDGNGVATGATTVDGTGVATGATTVDGTGVATGTALATALSTPFSINTSGVSPPGSSPTLAVNGTTAAVGQATDQTAGITSAAGIVPATTSAVTSGTVPGAALASTGATVSPTATDNPVPQFVPLQITLASSGTGTAAPTLTQTGIPTTLPKVIAPAGGIPPQPDNNTLIQIAFLFPLNYDFVASNSASQVQIFQFLPEGIADALDLPVDRITMSSIVPYDTTSTLNYITTIALIYIPTSMVEQLRLDIITPISQVYHNTDGSIQTLMNIINSAIGIFPGSTLAVLGGANGTDESTASVPTTAGGQGGIFNTEEQAASTPKKAGQVAGVAVGAAVAAAAYGAAMFFVSRRYKRKRSLHRRSSSILNPSEMRQTGSPALMAGALGGRGTPSTDRHSRGSGRTGNSARTAQISAPMMAENSLGWN